MVNISKFMPETKKNNLQDQYDPSLSALPLEELLNNIDSQLTGRGGYEFDINDPDINDPGKDTNRFNNKQYIKFMLQDILMAIPLSTALEISRCPRITPLPNLPDWVLGVSNIRGEIISIVDIKSFFDLSTPRLKRTQRLIIIHDHEIKLGILVDKIMGIILPEQVNREIQKQLYNRADSAPGSWTEYVSGGVSLPEGLLNIIDVNKLLSGSRMNAFKSD